MNKAAEGSIDKILSDLYDKGYKRGFAIGFLAGTAFVMILWVIDLHFSK